MNKVQFFYNDDLIALERKINKWLSANKEIKILETNLNSLGKPGPNTGIATTEKYVFYILYEIFQNIATAELSKAEEIVAVGEQMQGKIGGSLAN